VGHVAGIDNGEKEREGEREEDVVLSMREASEAAAYIQ
jgi:hypothetical protein